MCTDCNTAECEDCGQSHTPVMPPSPCDSPECAEPNPCSEVSDAACSIIQNAIVCGNDTIAPAGSSVDFAITAITEYFCERLPDCNLIMHAELLQLIADSGLLCGEQYRITDFKTIYYQPDFDSNGDPKNPAIKVPTDDEIEELIVTATSSNTIAKEAWSIVNPRDYIEYDYRVETLTGLYEATPGDPQLADVDTRGKITRRRDIVNNDVPFDFRLVLFKRYETVEDSGIFDSYKDTGFASSEFKIFPSVNLLTSIDNPDDFFSYQRFYQNNVIAPLDYNESNGYVAALNIWRVNSVFFDSAYNNNIASGFENNTAQYQFTGNRINAPFKNNKIDYEFGYNTVNAIFMNSEILDDCKNNIFNDEIGVNGTGLIVPAGFKKNIVNTDLFDADANFTGATHVLNTYTCTIFERLDGTKRLAYVNNSDVTVVVATNA